MKLYTCKVAIVLLNVVGLLCDVIKPPPLNLLMSQYDGSKGGACEVIKTFQSSLKNIIEDPMLLKFCHEVPERGETLPISSYSSSVRTRNGEIIELTLFLLQTTA